MLRPKRILVTGGAGFLDLPCIARSLSVRPGADDQDLRARRDQYARIGKANEARILQASTSEIYGDPEVYPQREMYRGAVNWTGIRACYDEGKRCAETLFFEYRRQHGVDIRVARIFNCPLNLLVLGATG